MSKSLDNYVGITEPPNEIFGKLMSISDELMWRYYELLSFRPAEDIAKLKRECADGRNPRDAKVALAQEIVARFHSQAAADEALAEFEARFRQGALPENMPEVVAADERRRDADRAAREAGGHRRLHVRGAAAHRAARAQGRWRRGRRQGARRSRRAARSSSRRASASSRASTVK